MRFCFFIVFFVLSFSFNANSAQCLKYNDTYYSNDLNADIYRFYDNSIDIDNCNDSVILTAVEYAVLNHDENLNNTLLSLFDFDVEIFSIVELALILAFLTSHYCGRVVRYLSK